MLQLNKVYLLSNLSSLKDLLENNEQESLSRCMSFYEDKIALQYCLKNNKYIIRIWKTKVLFNYWYDKFDQCGKNFLATIDFFINDSFIKINHLYVNDGRNLNLYNCLLYDEEAEDLVMWIIYYLKKVASHYNKTKIIIDVHENLRIYDKYYFFLKFEITKRRSKDNPFWLEAELTF